LMVSDIFGKCVFCNFQSNWWVGRIKAPPPAKRQETTAPAAPGE
jgi:hypothetical protein